jgi:hypothetical protein
MAITFKCPHCQTSLQAMDNMVGKQGTCPTCKKEVTVPEQSAETQSEPKDKAKKE